MATKAKKSTGKKTSSKVRDLAARNDPKGGAQKKEAQSSNTAQRGGSLLRPNKTQLA
ncbi:MAG: hypothetical protein H0X34_10800 [Chthoniobacterales bacterium]|nr:hypothetical protein [Chthoniobacterales bacterium]